MEFKIIKQKTAYQGFFRIDQYQFEHELFRGGWSGPVNREVFERGNAVAVLLHDPTADTVLLIEQFRPGSAVRNAEDAWMLEIVAGMVESGEEPEDVARRESLEEAGCEINELEHILDCYPSAGGSSELISIFYASLDLSGIENSIQGLAEEHEDILVQVVPRQQAMEWLAEGKIKAAFAVISLQWLALKKLT